MRSLTVLTALITQGPLLATVGHAQPAAPATRLHESVFLETDSAATKKLGALEEYLLAQQWSEAVQLANQILEQHGDKLIAAGTGRYIDLRTRCHALLATMNADGLKTLREQLDPQAQQWLEDGLANHDEAPLRRIVKQAFLSSQGDDALAALGDFAFERGAYGDARGYWEMTLPIEVAAAPNDSLAVLTYPDTDLDRAEMRARLVMCSLFQRDLPRFQKDFDAFSERHAEAQGTLAGQQGRLVDILQTMAAEAADWSRGVSNSDPSTFAGNPQRDYLFPEAIDDIGAVQWTRPLKSIAPPRMPRRIGLAKPIYLCYFPIVVGETLFVNDDTTISAYDALTGRPAWGEQDGDDATIYRSLRPFGENDNNQARLGVPRFTMTAHDGRLYARMGSPVTGRPHVDALTRSESHLVCLDIAGGEGKTVWTIEAGDFAAEAGNWEFEGSPVVSDGRLYVALRNNSPQPQANVACFDAEQGRLLWNRKVCTFLAGGDDVAEEVSHQLLTLGEGTLFYSTNQGAIAALDARDGSLNWVVTYERSPQRPWTSQLKNGLVPCLYHQGTVVVAPSDLKQLSVVRSDTRHIWQTPTVGTVLGIDAKTGIVKWSRELRGGVRHLLGVSQNRLIVSGDFLSAIDLENGQTIWQRGHDNSESHGYGRGLLAGDLVLWPKRDAIWVFNTETGNPQAQIPLGQWRTDTGPQLTGGNLLIADGMLIVSQTDALVAYSQWGRMKKRIREEISSNPDDPRSHLRLARIEQASGNDEAAIEQYRQVVRLAKPEDQYLDQSLHDLATKKLAKLLMQTAQQAKQAENDTSAARYYDEAAQLPTSPELRLKILCKLADAYQDFGEPHRAVETWQTILNDPRLSTQFILDAPGRMHLARDIACAQIDTLLKTHGAQVYASVEQRADEEITALPPDSSDSHIQQVLSRYPQAHAAAQCWLDIAAERTARQEYDRAEDAYANLLLHRDDDVRRTAQLGMARVLERTHNWHAARHVWRQLAEVFPNTPLPDESAPVTFASYTESHLQTVEFQRQIGIDAPPEAGLPLRRSWSLPLGQHRRLLVPTGTPPALQMQSVIFADDRLSCVNLFDGSLRWRAAAADEFDWAGYAGTRLLLCGPRGLEAVSLRTGRRIWRVDQEHTAASPRAFRGNDTQPSDLHTPHLIDSGSASLVCFVREGELNCLHVADGTTTWRFRPPAGTIQNCWQTPGDRCLIQTTLPTRTYLVDSITGTILSQFSGPAQPWISAPGFIGDDFLAVVSGTDTTFARFTSNGIIRWTYPFPISQTNAAPDFLTNGTDVTLVEDGDTLIGIGPEDGKKRWSTGLGVRIMPQARNRLCIDQSAVYAENEGILRCFRLDNGQIRWEQFLTNGDTPWRLARSGRYLLAAPAVQMPAGNFPVLFCDPATGAFIQKLQLPGHGPIDIHTATGVTLVRTDEAVHALVQM